MATTITIAQEEYDELKRDAQIARDLIADLEAAFTRALKQAVLRSLSPKEANDTVVHAREIAGAGNKLASVSAHPMERTEAPPATQDSLVDSHNVDAIGSDRAWLQRLAKRYGELYPDEDFSDSDATTVRRKKRRSVGNTQ